MRKGILIGVAVITGSLFALGSWLIFIYVFGFIWQQIFGPCYGETGSGCDLLTKAYYGLLLVFVLICSIAAYRVIAKLQGRLENRTGKISNDPPVVNPPAP